MKDCNSVMLVGRLTADAEINYTANQNAVCKFTIAVNTIKKNNGAWEDQANFFDIEYWSNTADNLKTYLLKGKQVAVTGDLRQSRWEASDGTGRSRVFVNANNVQLVGNKSDEKPHDDIDDSVLFGSNEESKNSSPNGYGIPGFPGPEKFDDEIPF